MNIVDTPVSQSKILDYKGKRTPGLTSDLPCSSQIVVCDRNFTYFAGCVRVCAVPKLQHAS